MELKPPRRSLAARAEDWRVWMAPFMVAFVVAAGLWFALMAIVELRGFYARVQHAPLDVAADFAAYERAAGPAAAADLGYLRFKTLTRLEADALQRRYHQATTTMLARVWTRQLGFLTGMILAMVGAVFVLGRLEDRGSKLSGEGGGVTGGLETSSPGLVLAALGAGLMAITLLMPFGVETFDRPVYFGAVDQAEARGAAVTAAPGPASAIDVLPADPGDAPPRPEP
jgi:hypothetical protein